MVSQSAEQVIVSASQRADPSLLRRWVHATGTRGLMRGAQTDESAAARVSLLSEEIDAIVFWTSSPKAGFTDADWLMNWLKRIQPTNPRNKIETICMFRKNLIEMLLGNPMTVSQIARLVDESPSHIAEDLNHLFRSLKHTEYKAGVEPARCRACGFEFSVEKLTKPSKCPECHNTWVLEPKIGIQQRS